MVLQPMNQTTSTTTPVSNLGDGDDSSNHNSLPRLYQKAMSIFKGFHAPAVRKAAPSAMLQNLREWSSRNPLFSKFVTLIIVCIFAAGVFAGASFLHASTTCGLIAQIHIKQRIYSNEVCHMAVMMTLWGR